MKGVASTLPAGKIDVQEDPTASGAMRCKIS